jgi:hypothetical protein
MFSGAIAYNENLANSVEGHCLPDFQLRRTHSPHCPSELALGGGGFGRFVAVRFIGRRLDDSGSEADSPHPTPSQPQGRVERGPIGGAHLCKFGISGLKDGCHLRLPPTD